MHESNIEYSMTRGKQLTQYRFWCLFSWLSIHWLNISWQLTYFDVSFVDYLYIDKTSHDTFHILMSLLLIIYTLIKHLITPYISVSLAYFLKRYYAKRNNLLRSKSLFFWSWVYLGKVVRDAYWHKYGLSIC